MTPEQFVKGTTLQGALQRLHSRGMLARIVIDEVGLHRKWTRLAQEKLLWGEHWLSRRACPAGGELCRSCGS